MRLMLCTSGRPHIMLNSNCNDRWDGPLDSIEELDEQIRLLETAKQWLIEELRHKEKEK